MAHGSQVLVMARGSQVLAHGSWLMAHRFWLMARCSQVLAHGSWLMAHRFWLMARGSQFELPVCFILARQDVGFPFNLGGLWLSPMHQF